MSAMRAFERAIKKAGGPTALAALLGVSDQVVSNWRRRGVPPRRVLEIEAATKVRARDLLRDEPASRP